MLKEGNIKNKNSRRLTSIENPRVRKKTKKIVKKLDKKTKKQNKLPGSFRLFYRSIKHVVVYRKIFFKLLVLFLLLHFIFVQGLAMRFQLDTQKDVLQTIADINGQELRGFGLTTSLFGALIGTAGSVNSDVAGVYQTVLLIILSLCTIWLLRYTYKYKKTPTLKQVMYSSQTPLIQLIIVGFIVMLQLMPLLMGATLYSMLINGGVISGFVPSILVLVGLLAVIYVTIYVIMPSIFAFYIVTLDGMTPTLARKNAKKIVRYRRWALMRKTLFLPIALLCISALIFIPLIAISSVAAELVFAFASIFGAVIVHSYFFTLYRSLL